MTYSSPSRLHCGDVVLVSQEKYVVVKELDDEVHVLPLLCAPAQRHRSDIVADDWTGFADLPMSSMDSVIRCFPVYRVGRRDCARIGAVSRTLLGLVRQGLRGEVSMRRYEDTAVLASNLVAAAHSTGRRQQPHRGA